MAHTDLAKWIAAVENRLLAALDASKTSTVVAMGDSLYIDGFRYRAAHVGTVARLVARGVLECCGDWKFQRRQLPEPRS